MISMAEESRILSTTVNQPFCGINGLTILGRPPRRGLCESLALKGRPCRHRGDRWRSGNNSIGIMAVRTQR